MRFFFKNKNYIALIMATMVFSSPTLRGQQIFSYDFDSGPNEETWQSGWSLHTSNSEPFKTSFRTRDNHAPLVNGNRMAALATVWPGEVAQMTGIYNQQAYNLSSDSLTYSQYWMPWTGGRNSTTDFGVNDLFRIGLAASDEQLVGAGQDSIFLGGRELSAVERLASNDFTSSTVLELGFWDESGTQVVNLGKAEFQQDRFVSAPGGGFLYQDHWAYLISQEYKSSETKPNAFDIALSIDKYLIRRDVNTNEHTDSFQGTVFSTNLTGLEHGIASENLSALYPALGFNVVDPLSVSTSGVNYDGSGIVTIPEPGGMLLVMLGGALSILLARRRD